MSRKMLKGIGLFVVLLLSVVFAADAFATAQNVATQASGLGGVAAKVTSSMAAMAKLISAIAYVAGMGFGVAAILKFKAHKDNPTQVGIGIPIAFLFISAGLLFLPNIFKTAGGTLYGSSGTIAGVSGMSNLK